jgi:hypothetical protein
MRVLMVDATQQEERLITLDHARDMSQLGVLPDQIQYRSTTSEALSQQPSAEQFEQYDFVYCRGTKVKEFIYQYCPSYNHPIIDYQAATKGLLREHYLRSLADRKPDRPATVRIKCLSLSMQTLHRLPSTRFFTPTRGLYFEKDEQRLTAKDLQLRAACLAKQKAIGKMLRNEKEARRQQIQANQDAARSYALKAREMACQLQEPKSEATSEATSEAAAAAAHSQRRRPSLVQQFGGNISRVNTNAATRVKYPMLPDILPQTSGSNTTNQLSLTPALHAMVAPQEIPEMACLISQDQKAAVEQQQDAALNGVNDSLTVNVAQSVVLASLPQTPSVSSPPPGASSTPSQATDLQQPAQPLIAGAAPVVSVSAVHVATNSQWLLANTTTPSSMQSGAQSTASVTPKLLTFSSSSMRADDEPATTSGCVAFLRRLFK